MNYTTSPKQTKVTFIHIFKTAGESISQCLLEKTKIAKTKPLIQFTWLTDRKGNTIFDFIGRHENFDRDWKSIGGRLLIKQKLPNLNISNRRPYQNYSSQ